MGNNKENNMENKGAVTVYITLFVCALAALINFALSVMEREVNRGKAAMISRSALSDVKANYNAYIFEHYHILLFDTACGGWGSGAWEEMMQEQLEQNLGDAFAVSEVAISEFDMLTDGECQALKEQIAAYMPYVAAGHTVESILERTGGKDGSLEGLDDLESEDEGEAGGESEDKGSSRTKDPRDYTKDMSDGGLLALVCPEGLTVSNAYIDRSEFPSVVLGGQTELLLNMNLKFDDYGDMKRDLRLRGSWLNNLVSAGELPVYAREVFNSATTKVNEDTVYDFEVEYLIHGSFSDYENFRSVVKQMIALRFPLNYGYLRTDAAKMAKVSEVAWSLAFATPIPHVVLKHLLAGCWAFVESIVDVRTLLAGHKVPFQKTAATWKTDIEHLEASEDMQAATDETGLSYDDYLTILLLFHERELPYRMLDLMQANARKEDDSFRMIHAAVGLSVDIRLSHDGEEEHIFQHDGY